MITSKYQFHHSAFRIVGYLTMLSLFILSIVFFRERTWLLDVAYQTFLMINEGTVQVMVNRFGAAIVQSLPLLGIKLGLPLWLISMLYSMSFTIFFLLIYFLIVKICENDYLGLVLVLVLTLLVFDSFYWTTSEQIQGLAVLLLFYAYLLKFPNSNSIGHWSLLIIGIIALAYYHPLIFIPFYFLWIFFGLDTRYSFWDKKPLAIAIIMGFVLILKSYLSANWYDNVKYNNFFNNFQAYKDQLFSIPSHYKFLDALIEIWYWFPILLMLVTILYIIQRNWWKLLLVWGFSLGYIFLLHIGDTEMPYRFYAEVNYLALTIFTGLPLVFDGVAKIRSENWMIWIIAIVLASRIITIALNHTFYQSRIKWVKVTLDENSSSLSSNKLLLDKKLAPNSILLMNWGLPFESLIISASEDINNAKTIYIPDNPSKYEKALIGDTTFHSDFKIWSQDELNSNYFKLEGKYKEIINLKK